MLAWCLGLAHMFEYDPAVFRLGKRDAPESHSLPPSPLPGPSSLVQAGRRERAPREAPAAPEDPPPLRQTHISLTLPRPAGRPHPLPSHLTLLLVSGPLKMDPYLLNLRDRRDFRNCFFSPVQCYMREGAIARRK